MSDPRLTHSGFGGYGNPTMPTEADVEPQPDPDAEPAKPSEEDDAE